MRRVLVVAAASLCLHTLLFFWLNAYRDLVFRVGRSFTYGHDIADLVQIVCVGFSVVAAVAVAAGILIDLCIQKLSDS